MEAPLLDPSVDLPSDTVTRPTPAMRRAIAEAVVGDDVIGDDPTALELERRVAALAGKEAAVFVPSGTMGTQLGIAVHTQPGDQVLIERESHIFHYEQAGLGANSGCLGNIVTTPRGAITPWAIDEFGFVLPLVMSVFALYFWSRRGELEMSSSKPAVRDLAFADASYERVG